MLAKCVLAILEKKWYQQFGDYEKKIKICSGAFIVDTTAKQVILRRWWDETGCEMHRDEKHLCKALKTTFFQCQIVKFNVVVVVH